MQEEKLKVLVIGSKQPGDTSGTFHTINNIFSFIPKKNIKFISFSDIKEKRTYSLNISHFLLPKIYDLMSKSDTNEKLAISSSAEESKKKRIKDLIIAIFDLFPLKMTSNQIQEIKSFNPDLIYSYGTNITNFKLVYKIYKITKAKPSIHIMDNWFENIYSKFPFFRRILIKYMKKVMYINKIHLTISEPLSNLMRNYFPNIKWLNVMNPSLKINNIIDYKSNKNSTYKCLYAGGLTLNRWKSLIDISQVINQINNSGLINKNIIFDVYVAPDILDSKEVKRMRLVGINVYPYVDNDKVYELYNKYDILFLTESFEKKMNSFLKYSLSTKVPEYLSSLKTIFVYMPKNLYTYEYFQKNNLGICTFNEYTLKSKLIDYLNGDIKFDINDRIRFVELYHSIESIKNKINEVLEGN